MNDTTLFISVDLPSGPVILFACDTYLYSREQDIPGKLMYSGEAVHGTDSIREVHAEYMLYKTAYRRSPGNSMYVATDAELQTIGVSLGLKSGSGVDQHLCCLPDGLSGTLMSAPGFLATYDTKEARLLADEIGEKYGVAPGDLHITGGLQLFPRPIQEAHDVDIVVPVDDCDQLNTVLAHGASERTEPVYEYGFRWPLRWRSSRAHLVCPFFVYRHLPPCVSVFTPTGEIMQSTVTVADDRFSIFNAPTVLVRGLCDVLVLIQA